MQALLTERISDVKARIDAAARRSGRHAEAITLVAVTKTHPAHVLRAAVETGLTDLGENYVQEAADKQDALRDLTHIRWHFIGHLQSNKVSVVAGRYALIHGVDSEKLARRLGVASLEAGTRQDVLVQVHLGNEATKSGVAPGQALAFCESVAQIEGVRLCGLMGIAPLFDGDLDTDGVDHDPRPDFAQLREIFTRLPPENRLALSMGMSGDFEAAIEEGATHVRIGSALFGPRPARGA